MWLTLQDIFGNDSMDQCGEGDFYIQSNLFKVVVGTHIVFSILALLANVWFLRAGFKKVYFHRNVKIIMAFSLASNIIHSFFCMILQGTHLYRYVTAKTGCDVVVPVSLCLFTRQPMNLTMMSFVPINVAIVIERGIATIRVKSYEKCNALFGFHLSIFAMLASILIIYGAQHNTPTVGTELYCSAVNKFTQDGVTISSYLAMALELAAILVFFGIWVTNYRKRCSLIFDVTTAYQVSENLASLNLLLPWMIFHFITFAFFNTANFTIPLLVDMNENKMIARSAYAAVYVCFYCCYLEEIIKIKGLI